MKQLFTISPNRIGSPKNLINPLANNSKRGNDVKIFTGGTTHSSRDSKLSTANSSINTNPNKSMLSSTASNTVDLDPQHNRENRSSGKKSRHHGANVKNDSFSYGVRKYSQNIEGDPSNKGPTEVNRDNFQPLPTYKEYVEVFKKEYEKLRKKNDEIEKENKELRDLLGEYRKNLEILKQEKKNLQESQVKRDKITQCKFDSPVHETPERRDVLLFYVNKLEEKLKNIELLYEREKKKGLLKSERNKSDLRDSLESQDLNWKRKIALLEQKNDILSNELNKRNSEVALLKAELEKCVKSKIDDINIKHGKGDNTGQELNKNYASEPISAVSRVICMMKNTQVVDK